jgi:prepilin-type N-terminal cleavage/methylation domain-containing protein
MARKLASSFTLIELMIVIAILGILALFRQRAEGLAFALDTAFQTQYKQEYIQGFEQRVSLLRETVTTAADIKGNTCVFLVADSGSAQAQTRGINGRIPARGDNQTQNSCILQEWHDLVRKTGFNVTASQGNQRQMMQDSSMGVINRKIDDTVITELATGTVAIGTAAVTIPNVSFFQNGRVKLSNASVPWDSRVTLLCQPSFLAYLEQAPEFANAEYVDLRPYKGTDENPSWEDKPMAYRWRNCKIVEHPNLPGKGTTSEKSFLYHQTAIGHAMAMETIEARAGYDEEEDYSWARTTVYMGAKLLQNAGVIVMTHDGSAYA